jgi:hypothetical protein
VNSPQKPKESKMKSLVSRPLLKRRRQILERCTRCAKGNRQQAERCVVCDGDPPRVAIFLEIFFSLFTFHVLPFTCGKRNKIHVRFLFGKHAVVV